MNLTVWCNSSPPPPVRKYFVKIIEREGPWFNPDFADTSLHTLPVHTHTYAWTYFCTNCFCMKYGCINEFPISFSIGGILSFWEVHCIAYYTNSWYWYWMDSSMTHTVTKKEEKMRQWPPGSLKSYFKAVDFISYTPHIGNPDFTCPHPPSKSLGLIWTIHC